MSAQSVRPAVVFSLGFVYDWKIGGYDFMEYMSRPEAFCADNHIGDDEYDPKNSFKGSDFLTYMSNEEKSDGLFDNTRECFTDEDKEVYRAYERQSRTEGCPKYYGVMSFDNDFLKEHGLLSPDGKHLDAARLKELGREGINALIHSNPKFENSNVYWNAAIHTNTDNVHIHYSICEYHRLEDRRQTAAGQDLIPVFSFNKLKSVVANRIIGDEHLQKIQQARDEIRTQLAVKGTREQFAELLDKLPDNILRSSKETAGYNSRYVKRYQATIQNVVKNIIGSDPELQGLVQQFDAAVHDGQELYRRIYGEGNQELYIDFSKNRYRDLQERLGNEVLEGVRRLYREHREHLSDDDASRRSGNETTLPVHSQEQYPTYPTSHLSSSGYGWDWSYQEHYPDAPEVYEPTDDDIAYLSTLDMENTDAGVPTDARALQPERPYKEHAARVHQSENNADWLRLEWSKGYKAAQKILYNRRSHIKDYKRAEQFLLSEGNNVLALDALAKLYATDKLGAKNTELSQDYYRRAFEGWLAIEPAVSEKMQSYVWYRIGKCYCYGLGTDIDEEQAATWFERAAKEGNKYAAFSLANSYYYGKGVEQSYESAFKWYSAAEEQQKPFDDVKMPFASYALAQMYERGEYVAKNSAEAYAHYKKALTGLVELEKKQPDENIRYKIGKMYLDGKGTEVDAPKAMLYLTLAAQDENSRAQYEVGKAYVTGHGVKQDVPEGLRWLNKAINNGNDTAALFLGRQLIKGEHIAKNTRKGIELLTACYSRHESDALAYSIGKAYLDPTIDDWDQGRKWLTVAAEKGNQHAQMRIGYEFYRREQYDDATKWYAAADKEFHAPLPQKDQPKYNGPHYTRYAASIDHTMRLMLSSMQQNTARLIREFEREQAQDEYTMKMNGIG